MALITALEKDDRSFRSTHPTHVVGKYISQELDGKTIFQLNTYGSENREIPDKLSQTIQLTEETAFELWNILGKEFGFR